MQAGNPVPPLAVDHGEIPANKDPAIPLQSHCEYRAIGPGSRIEGEIDDSVRGEPGDARTVVAAKATERATDKNLPVRLENQAVNRIVGSSPGIKIGIQ